MKTVCTADAAIRLMVYHPFWNELYYSMKIIEDDRPIMQSGKLMEMTLATDGLCMWVNPHFWRKLHLDHKISALAHEIGHKMYLHSTRRGDRDALIWNVSCDYVVNITLQKNGFKPIPGYWICDMKYDGWTAEAIYADIIKNLPPPPPKGGKGKPKPGGKGKPKPGGKGQAPSEGGDDSQQEGESSPYEDMDEVPDQWKKAFRDVRKVTGTPEEIERFEQAVEHAVQKALASARAMGKEPAGVGQHVKHIYEEPEEPWYNHLHRFMQSLHISEFNWRRMNKRHAAAYGIVAPANFAEALGEVVILRDASGSCYEVAQQAHFNVHINAIFAEAKPRRMIVADFDTMVHKYEEIQPGEMDDATLSRVVGGGGTDFSTLFDWISEQGFNPEVVIVLTDMMGTFPNHEPDFPVIWCDTYGGAGEAPFGEYLRIK